jgi:ABC-2 type transport system ATP-binding protein
VSVIVEAADLHKRFGETPAVNGVNLRIPEGQVFGLLGPNGAGKSTTIKMLCTLSRPTSGWAKIAGYDTVANGNEVRKRIGIIFQDPSLDDRLTARENLELHCLFYHVPKEDRKGRIGQVLEMVELTQHQDRIVRTFSGGMKRRLEIARGLLHQPKLLFLDEPTIGLDPQTRKSIWDYIFQLQKTTGLTIFMTTHYLEEAEYCHNIAVMDHGSIIAEGSPAQLKEMVSASRVVVQTPDEQELLERFAGNREVTVKQTGKGLQFEVARAESFLPELISQGVRIDSLMVYKPSLDDVFLHLTGRQIREESADAVERMRGSWTMRGRRMR